MPKTILARVTEPTFINSVLHMRGEIAEVDLEELGVEELGDGTPGLEPYTGSDEMAERSIPATPEAGPVKLETAAFVGARPLAGTPQSARKQ